MNKKYKNKDWLKEKYYGEGLSLTNIGDICDVSKESIRYYMDKFDLDRVENGGCLQRDKKYNDRNWLYQKYIVENLTTEEISKICNCNHTTIARHLKEKGIGVKDCSGENHYNWKGGRSKNPHSVEWNKSRERAIERDFSQCRNCGMSRSEHKEEFGKDIEVHHRIPRSWYFDKYEKEKAHTKMNKLSNLITLCKTCHMRIERKIQ